MPTIDDAASPPASAGLPEVRSIGAADLNWALAEGWKDFREKRGDLIVIGLIYPIVCLAAAIVTLNNPLLPLFFPLVAGLTIAGPAVASGFYELARRREEGQEATWAHFLDPLKGRSRAALGTLMAGLGALFIAWLIVAWAIYAATFGVDTQLPLGEFVRALFTTDAGWRLIIFGNLAGLCFAVVTLVFSLVSFPLVVDKPVGADVAVRTSVAAFRRNPRESLGWGLRVVGLLVLGLLPAAIGLAVVLPWLGYATWHLYTRLVVR